MICGHMRWVDPDHVLHVCIQTHVIHDDEHLLVPWHDYSRDSLDHYTRQGVEPPDWFAVLDSQARQMEHNEFARALSEDPTQPQGRPPVPDEDDPDHVKEAKWQAREEYDRRHPQRALPIIELPDPEPPDQVIPTLGGDPDLQPGYVPPGIDPAKVRDWERAKDEERAQREQDERERPLIHLDQAQCSYVFDGRVPMDGKLFRCGLTAGHDTGPDPTDHGEWQEIGKADPEGYSLGRSQTDPWQQVQELPPEPGNEPGQGAGKDAWRAPDDGDRAAEPPAGGVPDADIGWSVTGRGKNPIDHFDIKIEPPPGAGTGGSVASVGEVKGGLDGAAHTASEAIAATRAAIEKLNEAIGMATATTDGAAHDMAVGGQRFLVQAGEELEAAIQTVLAAIEQLQGYQGGL